MAEFKLSRLRVSWGGPWATSTTYARDTVVQFNGKMYLCLAPHTSGTFITDLASAYWSLQVDGKAFLGAWASSTSYVPGNLVEYGGTVYVCTVAHTSSTTLDLSKFVTYVQTNNWHPAWTGGTNYGVGDTVKYGGIVYTCNTEHTSIGATTTSTVSITSITNNASTLAITGATGNGTSVTLSFTGATPFITGQTIVVSNVVSVSGNYNGTFVVSTTGAGFVTFTSSTVGNYTSGGTISYGSTIATINYASQTIIPFLPGESVTISGSTVSGYNGTFVVQTCSSTQTTILNTTAPVASSGGTISGTASLGLEANQSYWTILYSNIDYKTTWTSGTRYKINDVVKEGAELFICTAANQDVAFTPGHWSLYMPGSELASTWVISNTYQQGDIVLYGGYSYISNTSNNIGNNPTTDTTDWTIVTSGFTISGEWNISSTYIVGSVVTRNGYSFSATANNSGKDPASSIIPTTYNSTGSSGTTLVVTSTVGLYPGMFVTGTGFNYGQYISAVVNGTTLTLNASPNATVTNGQTLTFIGVNGAFWTLLVPGAMFKGPWNSASSYLIGDTVVFKNTTYYCIQENTNQEPDFDLYNTYWVNYILHFQKNATGTPGDISYYNSPNAPKYTALPIGTTTYVLRVNTNKPAWSFINSVPNVYYVSASNGQDLPTYGTTWDHPWKTIQYACSTVGAGLAYTAAGAQLELNREYMVQEMYYWMLSQKTNQTAPFTSASVFDQTKTLRDARYVVDAIAYDIARGGNSQIVAATLMYFVYGSNSAFYNAAVDVEMPLFIAALAQLGVLINSVLSNSLGLQTTYQTQNGVTNPVTYSAYNGYISTPQIVTTASTLLGILTTALSNQSTATVPQPNSGLTATIFVKTGTYTETLPITIPENVALVGDELRGVTVQPAAVIDTVATATSSSTNLITAASTNNMTDGTLVQFIASVNSVGVSTTLGGLTSGKTYYVVGPSVTSTQFGITNIVSYYPAVASNNYSVVLSSASNANFNVTKLSSGSYNITISTGGSNYSVNDQVKILGTSIGGISPQNDIIITATTVVSGTITAFTFNGSSLSTPGNTTVTNFAAAGSTFFVARSGAGFTLTLVSGGSNYTNGDSLKILGTSIGGTSPQNDIIITVVTTAAGAISTFTSTGSSLLALTTSTGSNLIYGGGALQNMFYMRNGSGLRNMTLTGLLGTLTAFDPYLIARPTGGAYVSLDPGTGPNDTSAWIFRKSPYVQNVSTFGTGCIGYKVDGTLHAGGNKSIVSNDFTQILSDGIGIWCYGPGALTEAVSVFSYYNYAGYLAEAGGRIRATNGNSSYGTYGVVAEGYDVTETPITGNVFNQSTQVQASVQSTLSGSATLVKLLFANAGSNYAQPTTNLLNYSNAFTTSPWANDSNITLLKNNTAPTGLTEAWVLTGTSATAGTGYVYQNITINPGSSTNYTLSLYVYQGTAASIDISGIFSGTSTVTSNVNYVFATNTVTPSNSGGGVLPINYGSQKTLVSGWYRIWMTINDTNGANNTLQWRLYAKGSAAGSSGNYSIVYGAQTEISASNYSPSFYLETQNNRYTAFAYYEITGAGTGAVVVGDELRSTSIFNARVTDPGTGSGGAGYLTASNFAQTGTTGTLSLALVDQSGVNGNTNSYIGMRAYISAGTGAGQYGYISAYNSTTKVAQILQENFDTLTVTNTTSGTNILQLPNGTDFSKVYVNMPVQFIPKYYTTVINSTNLAQMTCTASVGGATNTLTVTSTAGLALNMPIYFIGTTFTSITTGYQYYVSNIIDSVTIQVSAQLGQSAVQLTTASGSTTVYYPAYNSYITSSSTTNMTVGLPILFTGTAAGTISTGTTYYISDIVDSSNFTISASQVNLTSTSTSSSNNSVNVGATATLIPLNPIIFTGVTFGNITANTKYYISSIVDSANIQLSTSLTYVNVTATTSGSNIITCSNTTGFIAGNPIKFFGTTFGNLAVETTYYIFGSPISGTQFQITGTPTGVTAITLNTAVGAMTARTATGTLALTTSSGSMGVLSTGVKSTLQISYNDSLSGTFSTQLFGGVATGTTYYIKTFSSVSNQITLVTTSNGGTSPTLTTNAGTMALAAVGWDHINPGTPIVALDTTSVYYIEPRTTFSDPAFTYSAMTSPQTATGTWVAIGYGLNYFIALPNTGTGAAGSADSSTWTTLTMPVSASWTGIAYGNGYWVAVASGTATAYVSKNNGTSWTSTTLTASTTWNSIAYGNGVFSAVANDGTTNYSRDFGNTWSAGSSVYTNSTKVVFGGGIFFISGKDSSGYNNTSTDGNTWTLNYKFSTLGSIAVSSVAYGNGRFIAVSSAGGTPYYSFDTVTWYPANTSVTASFITYGQGIFLATATNGTAYTSDSGLAWTTRTIPNQTFTSVAFGYTNTNTGVFAAFYGTNGGYNISAGVRAKGRAGITSGVMTGINLWEPGSGYTSTPTVAFTDPNVLIQATVTPRTGNGTLGNPTFVNRGSGYSTTSTTIAITGNGYADQYQTGYNVIMNNLSSLPITGSDLIISGNSTIYKVTGATAVYGTVAPSIQAVVSINPPMTTLLSASNGTSVSIRTKYSQARLTNHDFLNIGYGNFINSNYPGIPTAGYSAVANNQAVEANFGRVFYTASDQDGNFKVGNLFGVQQATGVITLSTSQFGLTGLSTLSLGGISVGGSSVTILQFSTDPTFIANSDNIISTQRAIKSYLNNRLSAGSSNTVTTTAQAGNLVFSGSVIAPNVAGTSNKVNVKVNFAGANAGVDGNMAALEFFARSFNHRSSIF